jgi:hypothetical protein
MSNKKNHSDGDSDDSCDNCDSCDSCDNSSNDSEYNECPKEFKLSKILLEYKFAIVKKEIKYSTLEGPTCYPYLCRTFDDAYKYASYMVYFDTPIDKQKIHEPEDIKEHHNKYYVNDYNKAKETGIVFRTPINHNYIAYEAKIVKNFDGYKNIEKLDKSEKNTFQLAYFSFSKLDCGATQFNGKIIQQYKFKKNSCDTISNCTNSYFPLADVLYNFSQYMCDEIGNAYHMKQLVNYQDFFDKIKQKKDFVVYDFFDDDNLYTELSVKF